jgi:hypothetical protein
MEGKSAHIAVTPEAIVARGLTGVLDDARERRAGSRRAVDVPGLARGYELS